MKKLLLMTAAAVAFSGAAVAELTTSGELSFKVNASDQVDEIDAATVHETTGVILEDHADDTDAEFYTELELTYEYSKSSKDGLSWGAHWEIDGNQGGPSASNSILNVDTASIALDDSYIWVGNSWATLKMGDTSANYLNDAADLIGAPAGEGEYVVVETTLGGATVGVAVDDAGTTHVGAKYAIGGLTLSALHQEYVSWADDGLNGGIANNGIRETGEKVIIETTTFGAEMSFAGFDIAVGTNNNDQNAYEIGYSYAGIGLTLSDTSVSNNADMKLEASYDIADGVEASLTYDLDKEALTEAGITVSF